MVEKSEVIAKFSSNPEVVKLVDKLWILSGRDNSTVEAFLQGIAGKEEDAIILDIEHKIDVIEQEKSGKIGGSNKRRNSKKKNKQIKGGGQIGIILGKGSKKYFGKAVFDGTKNFLGKFIRYDIHDKNPEEAYLIYLPAGLPDIERNYRARRHRGFVYFEQKISVNSVFGLHRTNAETTDPENLVDYDEYLKKSGIKTKEEEDEDAKGSNLIGVGLGKDSTEYFGKAVFNDEKRFLGKFIKYENIYMERWQKYQGYLTFLPAGLPDKPENYKTYKYPGLGYFKEKFSLNSVFGLQRASREISNPDNLVDYDEYLKKSGIKMKKEEVDEKYDEYLRKYETKIEEKEDLDETEEEVDSKFGGKTKRRKHKRRNNKSKRTRRQ